MASISFIKKITGGAAGAGALVTLWQGADTFFSLVGIHPIGLVEHGVMAVGAGLVTKACYSGYKQAKSREIPSSSQKLLGS